MAEPAPLYSIPEAPAPAGGAAEWVTGAGGLRLRAALFPVERPRGSVVLSPGRTEPIEKYYEVIEELRARGFTVLVHDWRGQGLSDRLHKDRLRGDGSHASDYVEDFRRLLTAFETRLPRPWLALGHSMGGALNIVTLLGGEHRFSGALLTAPMLGLALGGLPPLVGRGIAAVLSRVGLSSAYVGGPGDPLGGSFEKNILTHDQGRWTRTRRLLEAHPDLRLGFVTWGWLDFALALAFRLAGLRPGKLSLPMTVVAAGEERLVDNPSTRAFTAKVDGGRYVEIPGSFHEILMETDEHRAVFWAEFDALAQRALGQNA